MKKYWYSPLDQEQCLFQIKMKIGYSLWYDHWTTGLQGKVTQNTFKCLYKIAYVSGNFYKPLSGRVEKDPATGGSFIVIETKFLDFIVNKYISMAILAMTILVFILNGEFDAKGFFWGIIFSNLLLNAFIIIMSGLFWLIMSAESTYEKFKDALMKDLEAKELKVVNESILQGK